MNSNTDFKLKFDGQINQIDANVLINSLLHTTNIIQEINNYINSDNKISIKVKALERGTFLVHCGLIETAIDTAKNIFTKENIVLGSAIISSLVGVIKLKQFLKGKNPKEIIKTENNTTIINNENNNIQIDNITYLIYDKSPIVKEALSKNFESLKDDPSITGFEITDKDEKSYIRIDRDEFESLAIESEEIIDDERIIKVKTTLHIVRLAFDESLKWEFIYQNNRIPAKIKDSNFYDSINKGESFAKGDSLEVELEIIQKWDESIGVYVNKSYHIIQILKHIPRPKQGNLNFEIDS